MKTERILLLTSHVPSPDRTNGITVRVAPLLRWLSRHHEINLVACNDSRGPAARDELPALAPMLGSAAYVDIPGSRWGARAALARSMILRPVPLSLYMLRPYVPELVTVAQRLIDERGVSVVWSFTPFLSHVASHLARTRPNVRHVIDWIDSPALHANRKGQPRRSVAALRRWERTVNGLVDRAIYVAPADAEYAGPWQEGRVSVVPNGVLADASPAAERAFRVPFSRPKQVTVGFLGNMAYEPNHRAAMRLITTILPKLVERMDSVDWRVLIIGMAPRPELRALESDRVTVTGTVPEIWTRLGECDVCVFPMEVGAGLQNKILECLHAGRPVVATSICALGLAGDQASPLAIADSDDGLADAVCAMAAGRVETESIAEAGRRLLAAYDWAYLSERYERLLLYP